MAQSFAAPPDDARPMVRWWWFGPAVERNDLAREISQMRTGGFGGFEIQPVYPLALDDPKTGFRNLQFLSDEFLQDVRFAADAGRAAGLRVDITLGSGWPYGGPHIDVTQGSAQIRLLSLPLPARAHEAALPTVGAGEKILAAFIARGTVTAPDAAGATPLRLYTGATRVAFAPTASPRALLVFMESRTGQQVKRPGLGGEGFVLDHLNAAAVQRHLDVVAEPLLRAFGDHPPYSVFSDSLEVYGADWTDDLLAEFRQRRGYDLASLLPALFFDTGPQAGAIRHDWGLTLTELVNERYLQTIARWAEAHHTRFRSQTYGVPPVTLSSNHLVSLAEGEGAPWRQFTSTRWASSANHLYGQPVTSAESWTWLHSPAFRATPLDVKAEADALMLQGVNQFVAHGWPYSPPSAGEPGWAFYAAAVFNTHNPWWTVMGDVNAYLQRLSFLLRQGEPVADVAILLPNDDAWAAMRPGHASINEQMPNFITARLTQQILDAGYGFDYVDGPALSAAGFRYKILILPKVTRIAPALYRQVAAFAAHGGVVIAIDRLPAEGAGFLHAGADAREVRSISAQLFSVNAHNARQVDEAALGATLRDITPPDLANAPAGVGFVHRKLMDSDIYFVANTTNQAVRARLAFRAQAARAQWWEPRTGEAHAWSPGEEVALAPYESRVFAFGAAASAPTAPAQASAASAPIDLSPNWRVRFEGLALSRTVSLPSSWSDDAATRFYSGVAVYSRVITLSPEQIARHLTLLDFGAGAPIEREPRQRGGMALLQSPVREAAEVFVDGRRAGSVWAPPYTLDLAGFLHPGANRLEIRVANTAINMMAAHPPPDYRVLNLRFGERFQAQDLDNLAPLPSGLLARVQLAPAPADQ